MVVDWIEITGYFIIVLYSISLLYVTYFCVLQFHLLYHYFLGKKVETPDFPSASNKSLEWPFVTIQLPIFNERYVVERLVDCIAAIDYPKDRFEIQILDDSTDETTAISIKKAEYYKNKGYQIECIHRSDRTGFKAGALKEAMNEAKGEFIAIFDADFLPQADFLKKTIPCFLDARTGVVQTRWEHINQHYSLLTELQAFQLNVHFTVEQAGRYNAGYLLQFNGTAGIWRKSCIQDAGGWEADTLTEDLDLSYRAQMKGWNIVYLEKITAPAELPVEINGLKSQQYRWMKGGAETARKLMPMVWKSNLSLWKKFHASAHLLSSSIFIFVFIMSILSFPFMLYLVYFGIDAANYSVFTISLVAILIIYFVANVGIAWPRVNKMFMVVKFLLLFPVFLAVSMALSFHNSIAVFQGFSGKRSSFVRTPKYGIIKKTDHFVRATYFKHGISWISIGEAVLCLYFLTAMYVGWVQHITSFFILHFLLAAGYLILFKYAIQSKFSGKST